MILIANTKARTRVAIINLINKKFQIVCLEKFKAVKTEYETKVLNFG